MLWKGHIVSNVLHGIDTVAGWENSSCTSKADHALYFQIPLRLKAECLRIYNLLHHKDLVFQKQVFQRFIIFEKLRYSGQQLLKLGVVEVTTSFPWISSRRT